MRFIFVQGTHQAAKSNFILLTKESVIEIGPPYLMFCDILHFLTIMLLFVINFHTYN